MSQQDISQSRLSYSRDLLLNYQHIYKPDPTIDGLLKPYVVQPDTQSLLLRSQGSPYAMKFVDASARHIPKTTPVPRRKPANEGKYEKKQRPPDTATTPVYKPRLVLKDLSASQKENIEHNPPTPGNDLKDPHDPKPHKTEISHPPHHPYLVGLRSGGVSQSMQALRVGSNIDRDIGKINTPLFYDAKFGSIFSQSSMDGQVIRETKFENCGATPSTSDMEQLLTSYNLIENPLSPIMPLVSDISGNIPPSTTTTTTTTTTMETKPLHDQNTIIPTGNPEPWRPLPSGDAFVTPTKNRSPNPKKNQMTPKTPNFQTTPNNKSPYRNQAVSPSGRPISPLDEQRLLQRQKQIDYGYRTVGYLRYRLLVSKDKRKPDHPRTPKKKTRL